MSDFELDVISVGEKYPQWIYPDVLIQVHFRDTYWELVIGFPQITKEEIHELQYGDAQMSFALINHCLFLLFKFGRIPWCDAPYEPRLHSRKFDFYDFEPGLGAPLHLIIVDSANGEVKAMRSIGMGNVLSNQLHATCKALQEEPFNETSYHYMINKTYKKYPTSDKMLREVNPKNIFMLIKETETEE